MKFWKKYFDINAIFIRDVNKPLPDSNSAWNFAYIDWFKSWTAPFLKILDSGHQYFAYKPILDGSNDAGTHLEL